MKPDDEQFAGNFKVDHISLFSSSEKKLVHWLTPKIPNRIQTTHLTLSTIIWCLFIVLFGYLAQYNIHWLWGTSLMIFLQWFTDSLDGAVGRHRNTGLIKWGYYMDHFLDYIFLCSVLIGYSFFLNDQYNSLFFILTICGAFMVNSYLAFATTNKFKITYLKIGPTEIRFLFIIINTLLIFFYKTYLHFLLPYVLTICLVGLIITVYKTQKDIWEEDARKKLR